MENKNKKNKGLIICTIVMAILLVLAISYIVYDKFTAEVENQSVPESVKEEKVNITETEARELLKTVPFMKNNPYKELDAYKDSIVTINDVNDKVLLLNAYYKLGGKENLLSYSEGMPSYTNLGGEEVSKEMSLYMKTLDVDNILSGTYNSKVSHQDFNVPGGNAKYIGEYYGFNFSKGSLLYERLSKLIDYKIEDDKLIINEKFGVVTDWDSQHIYVLNKHVSSQIIENPLSFEDASSILENTAITTLEINENYNTYFDSNIDKFLTYKHTFNIVNDKFYWYSTELVN